MRAVILAAGTGSRLGRASEGLPKGLLQVGGRPLIHRQLDVLAEAGVSPVAVVVGHAADLVRESVGQGADFVFNPRYKATNSLYSFLLTRGWVQGPVLILNSDVLFDPELLERLLKAGPDSLAFDSSSGYAPEHMKVRVSAGSVVGMSKELSREETAGENVGMLYLSERSAQAVYARGEELVAAGREKAFLAEAVQEVLPLKAVDVAGIPWTEIDTPHDLERARRELWPLISDRLETRITTFKRRRRRRRVRWGTAAGAVLALVFSAAWLLGARGDPAWETVAVAGAPPVTLKVDGVPQEWCWLEKEETLSVEIRGPRPLRVDLRGILPESAGPPLPYVVEAVLDGARVDWHKFRSVPDPLASSSRGRVGDKDRLEIEVPPGTHTVGVRRVAGDLAGLLVRFRAGSP